MSGSLLVAALLVVVVGVYASTQLFTPTEREYVEVRDYQGVRLSSISDFRENSIRGPQRVNTTGYLLNVTGMVGTPVQYSYSDVLGFDAVEKVVTLDCVEGWSATVLWEGVRVTDLLEEADPSPDAVTLIFHAEDGYTTSLPLEYLRENDIIIAYKVNGVTLPDENGFPFQLVAESKWGYKWIRWITALELSDDTDYRGYWESRGYSNSADLGESFWER
ncbi:molybdopterin-dependent oxidoreductase [Candidatus Bathyarchaeota archaeon]|nr:molybdopterin-dependent oxidoreductase [Candidatus Bathyarchaeota archaeon]